MNNFTGTDFTIGAVVWAVCMYLAVVSQECLKLGTCDGGDMFLLGMIAVSMLAPAYIAMLIFSGMFRK